MEQELEKEIGEAVLVMHDADHFVAVDLEFLMLPLYRRKEVARFLWTDYSLNWRQLLQVG